ncbi:unnamed protein product [Pedinophyceae sp. YPF-701]|nr:unnamed protein product [Pedinophyceae sp. YPF-701]
MGLNYRAPLVREAQDEHTATVIFLHGLGDTGAGWFDVGQMLSPALPHVKFVFPNAPDRPITLNMGMRMPGWYDIAALDAIDAKEDADGINESVRYVKELVAAEKVPSDRVVVGGFSQGGAIALGMLRTDVPLAGVAGLSTYMPLHTQPGVVAATHKQTPVFQAHGDADQVVAFSFGTNTKALLEKEGVDVTWRVYNGMPHSACPEELQDLAQWLAKTLPPK